MKRYCALLLGLIAVLTICCACQPGGNGKTTTAAATTAGSGTVTTAATTTAATTTAAVTTGEPDPYADYVVLAKDGAYNYRVIKSAKATSQEIEAINNFTTFMKNKTKFSKSMYVGTENSTPVKREIVVNCTQNRPDGAAALKRTPYGGLDIRIVNGKIIVSAHSAKFLKNAFAYLESAIKFLDEEKTVLGIPKTFAYHSDGSVPDLPVFETAGGVIQGGELYDAGNGVTVIGYNKATSAEFDAYLSAIGKADFDKLAENRIGENRFYTFANDNVRFNLGFYPSKGVLKIAYSSPKLYHPVDQTEYVKTNEITLAQPKRVGAEGGSGAPGMGFILQLADGRYIVMDGGPADAADEKAFYDYLAANKPVSHEKPVIAMWILSHADGDHTGLAGSMLTKYKDQLTLEMIAYNAPIFTNIGMTKADPKTMQTCLDSFVGGAKACNPAVTVWKFHSGEKMTLGGVTMEVLFTQEEMYPNAMPYGNHTCSAWRFNVNGTWAVFLGDCETQLNQWMADMYGDELECDVLQAAHHGGNGAVKAIYEKTDPKVVLWPIDSTRFMDTKRMGTASGYAFNKILRNQDWTRSGGASGKRLHFAASETTVITFAADGSYTISRASD